MTLQPSLTVEGAVLVPEETELWRSTPGEFFVQWVDRDADLVGLHEVLANGSESLSVPLSKLRAEWEWAWTGDAVDPCSERFQPGGGEPMRKVVT